MPLTANTIVDDKFWIVEQEGSKIATIQATHFGFVYVKEEKREPFASFKSLCSKYDIKISSTATKKVSDAKSIDGYPCDCVPHNPLFDYTKKLPVFTKEPDSKSFYCAGYYLIKTSLTWAPTFCPKLIALNRSEFNGPYRSKAEMDQALKKLRSKK